jgi:hypothetical protein
MSNSDDGRPFIATTRLLTAVGLKGSGSPNSIAVCFDDDDRSLISCLLTPFQLQSSSGWRSNLVPKLMAPSLLALSLTAIPPMAGVVALPGCGCSDEARSGLSVTVNDGATGAPICDATVVASDGDYSETLTAFGQGDACQYLGATERAGTYKIAVMSGGRTASQTGIVISSGVCHVEQRSVTITLPAT